MSAKARRILTKLLEKDREKRFKTAGELRSELEVVQQNLKWVSRGRKIAAAAAVVLFMIAAFATYRQWRAPTVANIRSLAVLPLDILSNEQSQTYFSDGITEQLITDLSKLNGLRVISLSSVMQLTRPRKSFSEVAGELNVDAVVTGSIATHGKRVWISAQLTRTKPQQNLWAGTYERSVDDLTALHLELATTIAGQVGKSLRSDAQPLPVRTLPVSPDARDLYYMGKYNANKGTEESFVKAIGFFENAIAKSPSYAEAYCGLSFSYAQLSSLAYHYFSPSEGMPKAKAAALKALQLDDTLADAHIWLGFVKLFYDRDWSGAESEINKALALNPSSADAHVLREWYLLVFRRFDEARREVELAQQLDPLSLRMVIEHQWVRIGARQYRQAIDLGKRAIDTEPDFVPALYFNALSYSELGDFPKAISDAQKALRILNVPSNLLLLAHVVARAGNRQWAERLLKNQQTSHTRRYLCPYEVGTAFVSLHRKKEAYEWLEKAVHDRVDCMVYLQTEPWMDALRQDPEYRQLLGQLNLPLN